MSSQLADLHAQLIDYLRQGKFAEGIEDFYAEDVTAHETDKPPFTGRDALAAAEREFLKKVTTYHGIDVLASAIDDRGEGTGTVLYEAVMRWEQSDKGPVTVEQVVVERWKHGKVQSIRFYGNFDPN